MELTIRTREISVGNVYRRLAAIGAQRVARARAIVVAVSGPVPSSIKAVERRRDGQKAFGALELGGRGFFG